jgi:hypothetical protein
MSAEEKEALKRRMAEIDVAGAGEEEFTPSSLTPVLIRSSNHFILLFVSFLRVLIYLCGCLLRPDIGVTKLTISQRLKMGPVLATEVESHQTKT